MELSFYWTSWLQVGWIALQKEDLCKSAFRKSGFLTLVRGFCFSLFLETAGSNEVCLEKNSIQVIKYSANFYCFSFRMHRNALHCWLHSIVHTHSSLFLKCCIPLCSTGVLLVKPVRQCDIVVQDGISDELLVSTEWWGCHLRPLLGCVWFGAILFGFHKCVYHWQVGIRISIWEEHLKPPPKIFWMLGKKTQNMSIL